MQLSAHSRTLMPPRRVRARVAARTLIALVLAAASMGNAAAQDAVATPPADDAARSIVARVQAVLDTLHANGRFAGATAAFVLRDGSSAALAVGESDSA